MAPCSKTDFVMLVPFSSKGGEEAEQKENLCIYLKANERMQSKHGANMLSVIFHMHL